MIYNCSVPHKNISQWSLDQIDLLTGESIKSFNLSKNPTQNLTNILILNGTLKYGVYRFFYNFTLVTNDETAEPFTATVIQYVRVVPTGFIVSGFPVTFFEMPQTIYTVGPFDSLSFIPAFYSYDADVLVNEKALYYKFYCQLVDANELSNSNSNSSNMTTELYRIDHKNELTPEQLSAEDTCFKSSGNLSKSLIIMNPLFKF